MPFFSIQSPETDIFSSADLQWKDNVAYIPSNRILQFITGEELGSGTAPTKFKIRSSRSRRPGSLPIHRIRSQCWLKYTRYWCTYGPHDNRSKRHQVQEKSSAEVPERKRRLSACAKGEDSARGCLCHFNVKIMYLWPDVTQIHYVHRSHTDASGCICHGTLDPSAIGSRAQYAPKLSTDMRRWVLHQMYKNASPKQILQEHKRLIHERHSKSNERMPARDDFLNKHDVLNISKRLAEDTFQQHLPEAEGLRIWIKRHPELVLFYQEDNSTPNSSFILAIQTPYQEEKMKTLGHHNIVACDATYGAGKYGFSFCTLLVFDSYQNAIPIAWIITPGSKAVDTGIWMSRLKDKMNEKLVGWKPSCFVVDDPVTDVTSIRNVFDVPVFLSLWYLRKCWLKNLVKRVRTWGSRAVMFRRLGEIMYMSNNHALSLCNMETQAMKEMHMFLEHYQDEASFISYFREQWVLQIGVWINAAQNLPHTNQDINCALETYHANLKARLGHEGKKPVGRRIDWFVHKLVKDVDSHFWFMDFCKRWGLQCNDEQEFYAESTVLQAASIPDCNVTFPLEHEQHSATFICTKDQNTLYNVYNPDTEWACCDCAHAQRGNMCQHQVKLLIMKGVLGSTVSQMCHTRIDSEEVVTNDFFLDHHKPVKESVLILPSEYSTNPCEMESEDVDDTDESDLVNGRVVSHKASQGTEESVSCVTNFPTFEAVFNALADAVGDIENGLLAGQAANIILEAVNMISKLKARETGDTIYNCTNSLASISDGKYIKLGNSLMEQISTVSHRSSHGSHLMLLHTELLGLSRNESEA